MLTAKPSSTPCRVVQHVRGETCIPLHPQRIVAISESSLAHILALDSKPVAAFLASGRVYGILYLSGKTDGIELIESPEPNLEKLLLINPDLIIVPATGNNEETYKLLPQIAPTVVTPWDTNKVDWKENFKEVARVLEKTELATQLLNDYDRRVQELKKALSMKFPEYKKDATFPDKNHQQSIYALFVYAIGNGLHSYPDTVFGDQILDDLGLLPPTSGGFVYSEETLPEIDSDILFIGTISENSQSFLEQLQRKPLWSEVRAVQQNQVYLVNYRVWRGYNIFAANAVLNDIEKYLVKAQQTKFSNPP